MSIVKPSSNDAKSSGLEDLIEVENRSFSIKVEFFWFRSKSLIRLGSIPSGMGRVSRRIQGIR